METDDKKNTVYHLQIEAYSRKFDRLKEKNSIYSKVLFSHEAAWDTGKWYMADTVQALYDVSGYEKDGLSLQDFVADQICYHWTITEIDLELLHKDGCPKNEELHLAPSAHIKCQYDLYGELIGRSFWWYSDGIYCFFNVNSHGFIEKRVGDELPGAGQKFQVGDFVRMKRLWKGLCTLYGFDGDEIFVVTNAPIRNAKILEEKKACFENTYCIGTAGKRGEYIWDVHFHGYSLGLHENELVKYEGEVSEDSPLMFLRQVLLGEYDDMFTDEYDNRWIVRKLKEGEISLAPCLSWREIPELAALAAECRLIAGRRE